MFVTIFGDRGEHKKFNSQTLQFIKIENILGSLWTVPGKCTVHVFEMLDKMSLLLNN